MAVIISLFSSDYNVDSADILEAIVAIIYPFIMGSAGKE